MTAQIEIAGMLGWCGGRQVFTAFAPASMLAKLSFADVFDENTGFGYQRRFNQQHSLEFKRYIQKEGASTIPLTFNLRPEFAPRWSIEPVAGSKQLAVLRVTEAGGPLMAQVDCQHRLGYLSESPIEFAFMAFLGLSVVEEMAIFRDINGKAKGLSSSLLDYTEARISGDGLLATNRNLYQAMQLSEDPRSPWRLRLDRGGKVTVGTTRSASLNTMQHAVKRFYRAAQLPDSVTPQQVTEMLIDFWNAIALVLKEEWEAPRRHVVTKGIGVYCLMSIAGDLAKEAVGKCQRCDFDYFVTRLSDFVDEVDWTNGGSMKGYGGASGADAAAELLRHIRKQSTKKIYGQQEHTAH